MTAKALSIKRTFRARCPAKEQKRIDVDFPVWMLAALDREAKRLGVTRESIIEMRLAERLQTGQ